MSRGSAVLGAPQFAAVCELHVCSEPFRSWFVSSVMVTMFVTPALKRVLSVGLSVVRRMYCAAAGGASRAREASIEATKAIRLEIMRRPLRRYDYFNISIL